MVAEAKALLGGLKRCVAEGFYQVEIESDSLTLVQILQRKDWYSLEHCLWSSWDVLFAELFGVLYAAYIERESNQGADFLANLGCKEQKNFDFIHVDTW